VEPPKTPPHNPTGYYRRTFTVHQTWHQREVFLSFLGVDSAFYLWLNGRFVGFSKDSRTTAEFDITVFVHWEGDNTLEVVVLRYNDGSYLEDQDMWNLSGIFRSVNVYSLPKPVRIRDFVWRTSMEVKAQRAP
jgi:beta-galactosidase